MNSYCLAGDHVVPTSWMQWVDDQYACTKCIARAQVLSRHRGSETAFAMCNCQYCRENRKRNNPTPHVIQ